MTGKTGRKIQKLSILMLFLIISVFANNKSSQAGTSGWQENDGVWNYIDEDGKILVNQWKKIGSVWYFFDADAKMASDEWYNGYYLSKNGDWTYPYKASWKKSSAGWMYKDTSGWYAKNQWLKINGQWYYFHADGHMASDEWVNGNYFDTDGTWVHDDNTASDYIKRHWKKDSGGWRYINFHKDNMIDQWVKIDNKWHCFNSDGYMMANEWKDGCYISPDGTWTYKYKGSWKKDKNGWWFGDTSGWYAKNQWVRIDEKWYYFNNKGYIVTGWKKLNGNWYYFHKDGSMANCYTTADGCYLGANGVWVQESNDGHDWVYHAANTKRGYACNGYEHHDTSDTSIYPSHYDDCGGWHWPHTWCLEPDYYECSHCGKKKHVHNWVFEQSSQTDGSVSYYICYGCCGLSTDGMKIDYTIWPDRTQYYDAFVFDGTDYIVETGRTQEKKYTWPIDSIDIGTNCMTLKVGQKKQMKASVSPKNTTYPDDIVWSSDDESVVKVDQNGMLTAVGEGGTYIKASSLYCGTSTDCYVRVTDDNISVVKDIKIYMNGEAVTDGVATVKAGTTNNKLVLEIGPNGVYYTTNTEIIVDDDSFYLTSKGDVSYSQSSFEEGFLHGFVGDDGVVRYSLGFGTSSRYAGVSLVKIKIKDLAGNEQTVYVQINVEK